MNKPDDRKRDALRAEYHGLPRTANKLQWCTEKARTVGMTYGAFVSWLGV